MALGLVLQCVHLADEARTGDELMPVHQHLDAAGSQARF